MFEHSSICFENIIKSDNRVDFFVKSKIANEDMSHDEKIFFEFNCENRVSDTALILSFVALVMNSFDEIYIDLSASTRLLNFLKTNLHLDIKFKSVIDDNCYNANNGNIALLFSGGLDSLAAYHLFPHDKLKLIAFDYGGEFQEERECFNNFNPYIIKTNYRQSYFFKYSSKFYVPAFSVGAILFSEKLELSYTASGDILEAFHDFNCIFPNYVFPGSFFNLRQVRPVYGLTEIGTSIVVKQFTPFELISKSINSLAKPGSSKRLRKDILLNFVGLNIEINTMKHKLSFGKDYVMDFLYLHIYKHNPELASFMIKDVRDDCINFIKNHKLEFYAKLNLKSLRNIPDDYCMNYFIKQIFKSRIGFYSLFDYKELYETREFLCNYYKEENKNIKFF